MNRHFVFVYGSLLKGEPNHRQLAASTFVRRARTSPAFILLDLGAFPALVSGGTTSVSGEVYDVDDITLAGLDRLEGHPRFYRRSEISLTDGTRLLAYLLAEHRFRQPVIVGGDWRVHLAKEQVMRGTSARGCSSSK
jgi:gamma-glutamylaminecyclotransferase